MRSNRRVPFREGGIADSGAIQALGVSRATFFRLLKAGVVPQPAPVNGTKRRWWSAADVQIARDAIREHKEQATR
jgi:predicted DNA-binding transcriptional regulator AlpA